MIIINARFLTQPITGVQRYAIEISKILKKKYSGKIKFVTHTGIIHINLANELEAEVIGVNKSHLWEQVDLYLYLLRNGRPLLFSFGYTGPLFYKKQIVSIHDMAFKYFKSTFSKGFVILYNFLVPRIAKKSIHVCTVSESAKIEICKELNLNEAKISVIYNGLTDVFKQKKDNCNVLLNSNEERYLLTVSSHHPRKNYKRLIEAFSNIEDKSIKLYVIGNIINHFSYEININDINKDNRIKFLTNVSDKELACYYQNAELFVFPSLYEGFGIPVIEAMSMNLICVLSDIPVFREIGDDLVIYVNPEDTSSITEGINIGLKLKKKKIKYINLKKFNWENSTNKIIELLNKFSKIE